MQTDRLAAADALVPRGHRFPPKTNPADRPNPPGRPGRAAPVGQAAGNAAHDASARGTVIDPAAYLGRLPGLLALKLLLAVVGTAAAMP